MLKLLRFITQQKECKHFSIFFCRKTLHGGGNNISLLRGRGSGVAELRGTSKDEVTL